MTKFKVEASYLNRFDYYNLDPKHIAEQESDIENHIFVGIASLHKLMESGLFNMFPLKFHRTAVVTDFGRCYVLNSSFEDFEIYRKNNPDCCIVMYTSDTDNEEDE